MHLTGAMWCNVDEKIQELFLSAVWFLCPRSALNVHDICPLARTLDYQTVCQRRGGNPAATLVKIGLSHQPNVLWKTPQTSSGVP